MENFTENDWNHLHDCILNATWERTKKKSTREELVKIFNELPYHMKGEAYSWGMSDTLWREDFIDWYKENYK
jgi:hypothetical protein